MEPNTNRERANVKKIVLLLLVALPFIATNAQAVDYTETVPTLQWEKLITGTGTGGVATHFGEFNNACGMARPYFVADVDWLTGDLFIGYADKDNNPDANIYSYQAGSVMRIERQTSASLWTQTFTTDGRNGFCALGLDQRGRLYAAPTGLFNTPAGKFVNFRASDGEILNYIEHNVTNTYIQSGTTWPHMIAIDVAKNVADSAPDIAWVWGGTDGSITVTSGGNNPVPRCNTTPGAASVERGPHDATWRMKAGGSRGLWTTSRGTGGTPKEYRIDTDTCAVLASSTVSITQGEAFQSFGTLSPYTMQINANQWCLTAWDGGDISGGLASNGTVCHAPIGGGTTLLETKGFNRDKNGDFIFCGQEGGTGDQNRHVIAKIGATDASIKWALNFTVVNEQLLHCNIAPDGSIYAIFQQFSSNSRVKVQRYCCATFGSETLIVSQADLEDDLISSSAPFGNLIQRSADYCSDSWGFSCNWLFGLLLVGIITVLLAKHSRSPMMLGLGMFLGVGTAVAFGVWETWTILVMVLLIVAIAGHRLFNRGGDDE